ncbi:MAG: DUF1501 domain-containing protein [Pirellulales bacterium]|nr:DUF1501 domain-containing protein [Pirellulales bacterium]
MKQLPKNNQNKLCIVGQRDYPAEQAATRRQFLSRGARGVGSLALASLLNPRLLASEAPSSAPGMLPRLHFAPQAKRVIFLFQSGAPSQFELLNHRPKLNELHGQPMPESLTQGQRLAQIRGQKLLVCGAPYKFSRHGQSGAELSELLPHTARVADQISIVRTGVTEAINHDPAITFMQTGGQQPGRPTMGAWLSYGLGAETANLPAFVVLVSVTTPGQPLNVRYWGNGFLPSRHQGVRFLSHGDPVLYVSNPEGVDRSLRRDMLDALGTINQLKYEAVGDPEIVTRIEAFEQAFRMQLSVPELVDISNESQSTLDLYGPDVTKPGTQAANCLLARRLAERGVRFIQLYHADWDHHLGLPSAMPAMCKANDQAAAGLIADLKNRGMLEETLVVWTGEFGRTPMLQGNPDPAKYGRDHHMKCFSFWVAGGGFRAGATIGETDDFGYDVIKDPVHVHDLHATMLHLLGVDHEQLVFRHQGRDFRLTDVHGQTLPYLLA